MLDSETVRCDGGSFAPMLMYCPKRTECLRWLSLHNTKPWTPCARHLCRDIKYSEFMPVKTAHGAPKQPRKRLRHGQALTLQGRPIQLAPRGAVPGSKLAEAKAHGGMR